MPFETPALTALGRQVLEQEAAAVVAAAERLDDRFARAVRLLADASGRVIVSGVGKSGLIARKLAATLTSTGTPASYVHPVDSLHGDLGLVRPSDAAIVLSKSGESEELFGLVGALQRMGVPLVAITGAMGSTLARVATVALDGGVADEACPHGLAPTTSTTASGCTCPKAATPPRAPMPSRACWPRRRTTRSAACSCRAWSRWRPTASA